MGKTTRYAHASKEHYIVVFDGVCNLCNSSVNSIINHDPKGMFCFAPMQSDLAKSLVREYYHGKIELDTILLIKHETCYIRSNAILEITKDLSGFWFLLNVFKVIPVPVRDYLYTLFARNRYAWFGKCEHCMVPNQEVLDRFLGRER